MLPGAGRHFQVGAGLNGLNKVGRYPTERASGASLTITRAIAALGEFLKSTIAAVIGR